MEVTNNGRPPVDNNKVIAHYIKTKSLTKTGLEFQISRERVRQIRDKHGIEKQKKYSDYCLVCQKKFSPREVVIKNMCTRCYMYSKSGKKRGHNAWRRNDYPSHCLVCKVDFRSPKYKLTIIRGMCAKCAFKYDEKYRHSKIVAIKNWAKRNPDKVREITRRAVKKYQHKLMTIKKLYMKDHDVSHL